MGFNSGRHDYPDLHKKQEAVPVQVPSVGNTKGANSAKSRHSKFETRIRSDNQILNT